MKILIVEDNNRTRKNLENLFTINNFSHISTRDSEDAIHIFKKEKPDIIVTELQTPKISGLKLLDAVRKFEENTIFIFITEKKTCENIIKALQHGANNYIKKPLDEVFFIKLIKKYKLIIETQKKDFKIEKIISHSQKIEFQSSMKSISHIASNFIKKLPNTFDNTEKINIEIGLNEMLTNAVEHGNLEISSAEKQLAIKENRILELYEKRLNIKKFANRKVTIYFNITPTDCQWIIEDEGNGFDWTKVPSPLDMNILEPTGRGIFITKYFFDEFEYLGNGSMVRLKMYFF